MRTTHLLARVCNAEGDEEAAEHYQDEACSMFAKIKREREEDMPSRDLTTEDFNDAVTFWSR